MVQEVLVGISLIIGIAAILAIFARVIKQPPLISYLITGIIVGPLFLGLIGTASDQSALIQTFARIGVAFLLFIVGLNLDFRVLKEVGKVASIAGITEVTIMIGIGFFIALGFGMPIVPALYLGAALAFSSTVVVVKILSDKKEIDTLHGRIALGILIVEDFIAAIILMIVPVIHSFDVLAILYSLGKILLVIFVLFLFASFVLNKFMNYLARNQEALFLFGIAWALAIASLFYYNGMSLEIGALIAGMTLASSKYSLEIGGKMKPLRDFFVVLLFVYFGSQLAGPITGTLLVHAIIYSLAILIIKPIVVMSLIGVLGYKRRVSFFAGSALAQISEFSLIIILAGYGLGYLTQEIMSLAVLIAVITIGISSYSIYYSANIFRKIYKLLSIFEGKHNISDDYKEKEYQVILFGYHRIAYKLMQTLKGMKVSCLVVDYNPKVVLALEKEGIPAIYGDASDTALLDEIGLGKAKLVISTVPDEISNLSIREALDNLRSKAVFIATAEQPREAVELYQKGADYVIIPHHLGGDYASAMIKQFGIDKEKYRDKGKIHFKELRKAKNKSSY
ncbi:MAG: cation:proton antiporter [archaeon]